VYKEFIRHVLSDIAERRTQSQLLAWILGPVMNPASGAIPKRGERRREFVAGTSRPVLIAGKDVCYQGRESFRGSDASLRLVLATSAAELLEREAGKGRGANWSACLHVAEGIMDSPCPRLRKRFRHARHGRGHQKNSVAEMPQSLCRDEKLRSNIAEPDRGLKEIDADIEADKAEKARRSRSAPLGKLADEVRTIVRRYRKTNPSWRQQFEIRLGEFRFNHRDRDWYVEQITHWEKWLADFERRTGPIEWWECMPLPHLAQITHEHCEFKRAAVYYRKAICAAQRAVFAPGYLSAYACGGDEFRNALIRHFEAQIEGCEKRLKPEAFVFTRR
jgi:hypothetical protein